MPLRADAFPRRRRTLGPVHDAATPPLRVLLATDRLVAIDKPAWMLSVPGKGPEKQDCAAARVRAMFPHATGPLVVHRLDMETSGALVFGLDPDAQRDLSRQFERREVEKRYVALVREPEGPGAAPVPDEGVIDLPIRADLANRPIQIVDHEHGDASVTRWRVLERGLIVPLRIYADDGGFGPPPVDAPPVRIEQVRCALVEFEPLTGRTHQLRVHAAMAREAGGLGAPIVGDALYGPERALAAAGLRAERLMLHASRLVVSEPAPPVRRQKRPPGRGAQEAHAAAAGTVVRRRMVIETGASFRPVGGEGGG